MKTEGGVQEIIGMYLNIMNAISGKVWHSLNIILRALWLLFPFLAQLSFRLGIFQALNIQVYLERMRAKTSF